MHDFSEDVSVGKRRSFRIMKNAWSFLDGLLPKSVSGVKSHDLECECPPFRIIVILLEDVDSSHILPLMNWFFDDFYVKDF